MPEDSLEFSTYDTPYYVILCYVIYVMLCLNLCKSIGIFVEFRATKAQPRAVTMTTGLLNNLSKCVIGLKL